MGAKICLYHEKSLIIGKVVGAEFTRTFPDFLVGLFQIRYSQN